MEHLRTQFLDTLWARYQDITPSATRIHQWLRKRGEQVLNDHIALRTLDLGAMSLERLEPALLEMGYQISGQYHFQAKKLRARSYSVPDRQAPRVFLSELLTSQMPEHVQSIAQELAAQAHGTPRELLLAPSLWEPVALETYHRLLEASEYAAWLAVFGLRANHFTVAVNALHSFDPQHPLRDLCQALQVQGLTLNQAGGVIKGSPQDLLEQASTLADPTEVPFAQGQRATIPGCYVEFAWRHTDPATGQLFDGFVTDSADRIFASTDAR